MSTPVVVMRGDGISPWVVGEALRVLSAAGASLAPVEAEIGWDCWRRTGTALPEATLEALRQHRVGLIGAITSPRGAQAAEAPGYVSPILGLRRNLALETSLRPCRTLPGHGRNFIRRGEGGVEEPLIDVVVVMQNTQGLYAGVEWSSTPEPMRAALSAHPQFAHFASVASDDLSVACRLSDVASWRRIARAAFEHARVHGRRRVVLCDKWGVMSASAGRFFVEAERIASAFPEVELEALNVDTLAAQAVREPERFDVILCSALIGDILSDLFAGLTGGVGMAACANLGAQCAVFEPLHGSAPIHAQSDPPRVNPIGAILAAAMLADHIGEAAVATRVRSAVRRVVEAGEVRTYDMHPGGATRDAAAPGAALTDAIVAAL